MVRRWLLSSGLHLRLRFLCSLPGFAKMTGIVNSLNLTMTISHAKNHFVSISTISQSIYVTILFVTHLIRICSSQDKCILKPYQLIRKQWSMIFGTTHVHDKILKVNDSNHLWEPRKDPQKLQLGVQATREKPSPMVEIWTK